MSNPDQRTASGSIPLAIKWSLSIAGLIALVMALLGWFLIEQQKNSYRHQTELLGQMIADQLARSASEPMMADDLFTLELLVSQQEKNELIVGMQIFDLDRKTIASAGLQPDIDALRATLDATDGMLEPRGGKFWSRPEGSAIYFLTPVLFQDTLVAYAMVSIDRRPLEENLSRLTNALVATTIGLMILGVLLAFLLAHRLARPIHQLVEAGEAIHRGESDSLNAGARRDEIGKVLDSFQHMAKGLEQKKIVEKAFSRYLDPSIAQRILSGAAKDGALMGMTAEGSVLFCDIVAFTELSESLPPEEVAGLLNDYFGYFALAASSCQGTVDKFIGDCIMVVFGVPEHDSQHALHAITCAVLIQELARQINQQREEAGLECVQFRIGINSGTMLAGNLGNEERMQYTVVGDVVNVASRICDLASPGGILLTGESAEQPGIDQFSRPAGVGSLKIRGRKQQVKPYYIDLQAFNEAILIHGNLQTILAEEKG